MSLPLLAAIFSGRDADGPNRAHERTHERVHGSALGETASERTIPAADRAFLEQIRAGDVRAYEDLFRAYFSPLSDFCESIVGTSDAAEEIVQDVLWSLWERRVTLEVHESIRAYLFSAVRYRALNDLRNRRHRATLLEREAGAFDTAEWSIADRTTEIADLVAHLRRAVAALPAGRRHVLSLRWDHGLSYAEIATVLGSSVKAVENQLNRTLNQLRRELETLID
jgi:RNA polymerase sigma-70 factor (ECF subfamily)